MQWHHVLLCSFFITGDVVVASPVFRVQGEPVDVVQNDERFRNSARSIATEIDSRLDDAKDAAGQKLLLALRVHLALHFREDQLALRLAERIRGGVADPGERAHSGLITQALVSSRRDPVRFECDFTQLLRALPRDSRTKAALVRARQKIEEMSADALLSEIRETVAPRIARGEPCTLEMADALVRAGHRLRNILPLRAAILRAYSAALAAQN
jgi:hypothetical protein